MNTQNTITSVTQAGPDGAFGLKFGETLDNRLVIAKNRYFNESEENSLNIEVPKTVEKYFQSYRVQLTPITKKIWSIHATGNVKDCSGAKTSLAIMLQEKYPNLKEEPVVSTNGNDIRLTDNEVDVYVICCSNYCEYAANLDIIYTDYNLFEQAKQEQAMLDAKSIDISAL